MKSVKDIKNDKEHMIRLGQHVVDFAVKGGWTPHSKEGAFEYVQRHSYAVGIEDAGGKVEYGGTETNGSRWPISALVYPRGDGGLDDSSLGRAHSICHDAGVPEGEINERLEKLREVVTINKAQGAPRMLAFLEKLDQRLAEQGYTHDQRLVISRVLITTEVTE
jgi:hypothetical protein